LAAATKLVPGNEEREQRQRSSWKRGT
jgi:hypothetical protein